MATIQIKRGAAAGLPTLASGEPGWTTDTNVLYVGTGAGNVLIGPGAGYTNEEAQDAVGTIFVDSATIDFTYNDGTPSITGSVITQMSLTSDASGLKLSGDSATPGNSKLYGTDSSGVKGWYAQPATTYTDEEAQDAVGTILTDSATIDFSYNDGTPSITADVKDGSITYAKMQDVSAASRLLGRGGGAGAGDVEEIVLQTNILEMGTSGGLPVLTVNLNTATGLSYTTGGIAIGTVPAANGGTAQTTWTAGDLLYASAANTLAKLAVGAAGKALVASAGLPAWGTLAETGGGTNQTTYTTGDVLYASAANTLAKLAVGSAAHVLTVASGVPSWAAVPTATTGGAALGSDFTFTSTSYGDSGLSIALPAAGTYLILGTFSFRCQVSAGQGAIDVQLYNTTDSAAVASSDRRAGACTGQDLANWSSSAAVWVVTVAASKTIRLEAKRVALSSPTWVASVLVGTYTLLHYVKLST